MGFSLVSFFFGLVCGVMSLLLYACLEFYIVVVVVVVEEEEEEEGEGEGEEGGKEK